MGNGLVITSHVYKYMSGLVLLIRERERERKGFKERVRSVRDMVLKDLMSEKRGSGQS